MKLLSKMLRAAGERKSTELDLLKIENRIKKLLREDSKIKRKMELTRQIGEKLSHIKDQKVINQNNKIQYYR